MPSEFGTDYSRFMAPVPGEEAWIPFPHPANDGQRVANARARAARAGTNIGSGFLNPQTGELQDPDRGFGRAVLSRPEIMIPLVLGSGLGVGALAGPAAQAGGAGAAAASGAGGVLPSSSIPTSLLMGGPSAASAGMAGAAGAASAAGAAGNALANGGNALANGGGLLNRILDWAPVGAAAFGAGRQLLQGPPDAQQNLERILKMAEGRVNASQPVFDQLNRFVQARMPAFSREG